MIRKGLSFCQKLMCKQLSLATKVLFTFLNLHIVRTSFQKNSRRQKKKRSTAVHPKLEGPFVNFQIHFIQMPKCCNLEYVLVVLGRFSGWRPVFVNMQVKRWLQKKQQTITERTNSFNIPLVLESNKGTLFTGEIMQNIGAALQTEPSCHCAHHPQSHGTARRKNILKHSWQKVVQRLA